MVSDRALIGLRAFFRSFVKYGISPHFRESRWRWRGSLYVTLGVAGLTIDVRFDGEIRLE